MKHSPCVDLFGRKPLRARPERDDGIATRLQQEARSTAARTAMAGQALSRPWPNPPSPIAAQPPWHETRASIRDQRLLLIASSRADFEGIQSEQIVSLRLSLKSSA